MRPTLPLLAAGAALLTPAAARADTVVAADPTATNVTTYGSTSAWSRRDASGMYHLVVDRNGTVADAPVPASSQPYDPDLGPTVSNDRVIVYARGGDIWSYVAGGAAERKVTAISRSARTESAPSFFKGNIAFAVTSGAKRGTYLYRANDKTVRLTSRVASETDLNQTRMAWTYRPSASGGQSFIRLSNYNGRSQSTVARASVNGAGEGDRVLSPTLSRFNVFWLRQTPMNETTVVQRVGVNAHRGLDVLTATRTFNALVDSLSSTSIPARYTSPAGVSSIDPKLDFAPAG